MADRPPERIAVSVVTIGELRLGVLAAEDGFVRAQRLRTLSRKPWIPCPSTARSPTPGRG